MLGSLWFDLILLLFLLGTVAGLFWLRRRSFVPADNVEGAGWVDADNDPWSWVRGYFPRLSRQAGYDPAKARWIYWPAKIVAAILVVWLVAVLVAGLGFLAPLWLLLLVLILAFFIPDFFLQWRRRRRQARIRAATSYFLDLIVALLHSGLSLEEAFRRAGRDGFPSDHPLAKEVALVSRELDAGADRAQAFQSLADRTGVVELRGLAAALRGGSRLGASIERTLEAQAEVLRTKRREEVRRTVNTAMVKALVPLLLCGLPLFLVIVFFPVFVQFSELFRELSF